MRNLIQIVSGLLLLIIIIITLSAASTIARPLPGRLLSGGYGQSGSRMTGSDSRSSGSATKTVPPAPPAAPLSSSS
ncbi:hypothetical protein LINPERPRIM_LOCUS8163, partial [Linum perenne]